MAYRHAEKGRGDIIRSADWNAMGYALEQLDQQVEQDRRSIQQLRQRLVDQLPETSRGETSDSSRATDRSTSSQQTSGEADVHSLQDGSVSNTHVASDAAIAEQKIALETTGHRHDGFDSALISYHDLVDKPTAPSSSGPVSVDHMQDGAITEDKLSTGAVSTSKLQTGAVTGDKLSAGAVSTEHLRDRAVTNTHVATDAAIAEQKIAFDTTGHRHDGNDSAPISYHDLVDRPTALSNPGPVTADQLQTGAVTGSKLSSGSVSASKLASGAVTSAKLATGAVSTEHLEDGVVTQDKLSDEAVSNQHVASDAAISEQKIAFETTGHRHDGRDSAPISYNDLIDKPSAQVSSGSVVVDQLQDGSITSNKLATPLEVNGNLMAEIIYARTVRAAKFEGDGSGLTGISDSDPSDQRLKTDIRPLEPVMDNLRQLQGVYYRWNNHERVNHLSRDTQIGLIADDVEQVFPELVSVDISDFKKLSYSKLTAILLEGLKEQAAKIEQLEERLSRMENPSFETNGRPLQR